MNQDLRNKNETDGRLKVVDIKERLDKSSVFAIHLEYIWVKQAQGLGSVRLQKNSPLRMLLSRHRGRLSRATKLAVPPGYNLVRALEFICRKKTYEHVILPMHGEYFHEYCEAIQNGRIWKARWIKTQMHFFMVWCLIGNHIVSLVNSCIGAFKTNSDD